MALFHGETHTLATTAGKIIIYSLATTMSSPHSVGNPRLARTGSGRAPLHPGDPCVEEEEQPQVDEVMSQLEQLVDLLEQYFHPSNNGRLVGGYLAVDWEFWAYWFVVSFCMLMPEQMPPRALPVYCCKRNTQVV